MFVRQGNFLIKNKRVLKSCVSAHLLQTEDEGLGTKDLVDLSGLTESFLDDVAVVVVVLRGSKNIQFCSFPLTESLFSITLLSSDKQPTFM